MCRFPFRPLFSSLVLDKIAFLWYNNEVADEKLAQLAEHLPFKERVEGSNPSFLTHEYFVNTLFSCIWRTAYFIAKWALDTIWTLRRKMGTKLRNVIKLTIIGKNTGVCSRDSGILVFNLRLERHDKQTDQKICLYRY